MYVDEYGPDCPAPGNRNCVYLNYLDSLKEYFRPADVRCRNRLPLRSFVFMQLITAYMKFVALTAGTKRMIIWSCPPDLGEEYILYSRPPQAGVPQTREQRDPMLRKWYVGGDGTPGLVQIAIEKNVAASWSTLPEVLPAGCVLSDIPYMSYMTAAGRVEQLLKSWSQKSPSSIDESMMQQLRRALDDEFCYIIVVELLPPQEGDPAQEDDPPHEDCELLHSRDTFLANCRSHHLQFDSDRRAQYSTAMMLYFLHNADDVPVIAATCSECGEGIVPIDAGYRCESGCDAYDLCEECHTTVRHPHPMVVSVISWICINPQYATYA